MALTANDTNADIAGDGRGTPRARCLRAARAAALAILALAAQAMALPSAPRAQTASAAVSVNISGGYVRLLFRLSDDIESEVRKAGSVLVVAFKQPVDVAIEDLILAAPDIFGAARRDPDGKAVRIALKHKVIVNAMPAGDKLFIDLLPETWTGVMPGLPQEVIEDLTRRARDAEKRARQRRQFTEVREMPPVRLRVATLPTFTRYVFELSQPVSVASDHGKDKLTLTFDAPVRFDLADAKAALPPMIGAIESGLEDGTALVKFAFVGKVDVRTFREDNGFVVDVSGIDPKDKPRDVAATIAEMAAAGSESAPQTPSDIEGRPKADEAKSQDPAMPEQREAAGKTAETPAGVPEAAAKPTADDALSKPPVGASPQPATPKQAEAPTRASDPNAPVAVAMTRQGDNLKLAFPFGAPVSAAVFRRADTLWVVFDSSAKIDLAAIEKETSRTIRNATVMRTAEGQVVRIKLERPRLSSIASQGSVWTVTIGEVVFDPTRPLDIVRNVVGASRTSVTVPFEEPQKLHRIADPDIGDTLLVVTGHAPARGFLKTHDFVEFRALASTHGVVVQPIADDIAAELSFDKIVVGRPGGLILSRAGSSPRRAASARAVVFDTQNWGFDRQSKFVERQSQLIGAAAAAPESRRMAARLDVARFYLSRDMFAEAKGVLDVVLADERVTAENPSPLVLRAVSNLMLNRPDLALKDLANPVVGNQGDAPLWRALAYARQGKWPEAQERFKAVEAALATLPIELQRQVLRSALRSAIEVRDFADAGNRLNDFETIGVPREIEPVVAVLTGRLAEGMGRRTEALSSYRAAADSWDRPAAAQGRLREIVLRYQGGEHKRTDVISELESLTTIWRGDETEAEALQLLARLYTEEGRYRDAFHVMRTALTAHPNSELTQRIQDEAMATFDALFIAGKGDTLPAIDALSMFYDFRELTPIGRRGDELIRRLADRLVAVDLLDQAAELLQHQVDNRLQGAARAQVATRLAVIYLMNRKPDRALATLRATRTAELTNDLRNLRLLLEARALSDTGRHDLALEVISNVEGREAIRLRSDIHWAARRWGLASEQIELLYGERWREWQPLSDAERADVLRAAIGYALGEDAIGLGRFREKYAAKMAEGPDRRAFEVVSTPLGSSGGEFREIAKMVAAVDTLDAFLRDMRARFPEIGTLTAASPAGAAPAAAKSASSASPPGNAPAQKPDPSPTGAIAPITGSRAALR